MSSLNKVQIIGNLTRAPEARSFSNGGKVVNFTVATSERWTDKSGQKQERSQFHNVAVFNEKLGAIAESYLHKGSKVYVEGQLETRKWTDKDGQDRYTTEIILRPFRGEIVLLDRRGSGGDAQEPEPREMAAAGADDPDSIPF